MAIDEWRALALREIEVQRAAGNIRSSLEAEVEFAGDADSLSSLQSLGSEARHAFIVSAVSFVEQPDSTPAVTVRKSAHTKCARCWHHEADIGVHVVHAELCGRCVATLSGSDGGRRFV